ncbi:MAG: hypothetical protein LBU27_04320 [Candidatus Peribacteria bacterium]|nr:hypothetical protein [Candidatus Peribacteria bacterium]
MQIASFIGKYHIPTSSLQALYFFDEGGNPLMELEITPLDKVFPLEETKFSFFYKNDDGVCNYKSTDGSVFTQKQKDIQGIKNTLIFHTTDWKQ